MADLTKHANAGQQQIASAGRERLPVAVIAGLVDLTGGFLRGVPFRGRGRVANVAGRVIPRLGVQTSYTDVGGVRISVRLTDRIERWMWAGCYEPELVQFMTRVLSAGMVFVDVGAHIGYFTALASSLVRDGGVHAFEADPDCFQQLMQNTGGLSNVSVYQAAVAEAPGIMPFYRASRKEESGWGSLFADAELRTVIDVPATTLDCWAQHQEVQRVDLIKIDAEGGEYRVLKGAESILREYRPTIVMEVNEVCLARDRRSLGDLVSTLEKVSYLAFSLIGTWTKTLDSLFAVPRESVCLVDGLVRGGLSVMPIVKPHNASHH